MSGIPTIPAGAQLGGAGTAANQAAAGNVAPTAAVQTPTQAPVAPVGNDTPPVPVRDPVTGNWVLPQAPTEQAPPSTPLVPVQATVAPTAVPTQDNPAVVEKPAEVEKPVPEAGESYLETTVNHFSAEIGTAPEAIMDSIADALKHGDAGLINIANLGSLDAAQAQRATQLAQMVFQHTQQEITNIQNTVHAVAGGAAEWDAAIQAFNSVADDTAKGFVAYLADGRNDGKTAAEYVMKYVKDAGLTTQVTKAPVQGGTGAPVATGLSVQEYKNGIHEIEMLRAARTITQSEYDVRMNDLDARRAVGRQQGR